MRQRGRNLGQIVILGVPIKETHQVVYLDYYPVGKNLLVLLRDRLKNSVQIVLFRYGKINLNL